jgi:hypothetical protein
MHDRDGTAVWGLYHERQSSSAALVDDEEWPGGGIAARESPRAPRRSRGCEAIHPPREGARRHERASVPSAITTLALQAGQQYIVLPREWVTHTAKGEVCVIHLKKCLPMLLMICLFVGCETMDTGQRPFPTRTAVGGLGVAPPIRTSMACWTTTKSKMGSLWSNNCGSRFPVGRLQRVRHEASLDMALLTRPPPALD